MCALVSSEECPPRCALPCPSSRSRLSLRLLCSITAPQLTPLQFNLGIPLYLVSKLFRTAPSPVLAPQPTILENYRLTFVYLIPPPPSCTRTSPLFLMFIQCFNAYLMCRTPNIIENEIKINLITEIQHKQFQAPLNVLSNIKSQSVLVVEVILMLHMG